MPRAIQVTHTFTTDAFRRVSDLAGQGGQPLRLLEGFWEAQTNGLKVRYGDETQPADNAVGGLVSANSGRGVGPVKSEDAAWDLNKLWFANAAAGSNGVLVLQGVVA